MLAWLAIGVVLSEALHPNGRAKFSKSRPCTCKKGGKGEWGSGVKPEVGLQGRPIPVGWALAVMA